ncbi:MAG: methionine gamma-lyase family protein [Thermincola sp.]|jgi:cystathionine beta-lyase family protein involved in aluminum resistance|nr:methionine gamma-lyase family protein [Thermincola sp.]MDT3704651.1 methionine gamma-lyase family protein [Thermincola sp.]
MTEIEFNRLVGEIEEMTQPVYRRLEEVSLTNHKKVLEAFHQTRVSEYHLKGSTGYGYGDAGRQAVEDVYAAVYKAEAALVRGQIASGTHAIALCLFGILRPGDELLFISGKPYDTLEEVIGVRGSAPGSLREMGVSYQQVEMYPDGSFNHEEIKFRVNDKTKIVMIQRSCGYDWRSSSNIAQIAEVIRTIRSTGHNVVIFVDNCYGEFVEESEPIEAGADLVAGSLIKNMGGGVVPSGGYVAGRAELVEMAAGRLTAPGIGGKIGATLEYNRWFLQGLFLAPHVVCEALKGAVFAAALFEKIGYEVSPTYQEFRSDIIQGIRFGSSDEMVAFCRGLQKGSPLDGHVIPEPAEMPGYDDPVIMAGGTFVSGSTIELSADGPLREPYAIYMQGGLSKEYVKLGIISAAQGCLAAKTNK